MIAPVVETAAIHTNLNLVFYMFSLAALLASVASILHYRETLGRPLLLHTAQLKGQREEDEQVPLLRRYAPLMDKFRED